MSQKKYRDGKNGVSIREDGVMIRTHTRKVMAAENVPIVAQQIVDQPFLPKKGFKQKRDPFPFKLYGITNEDKFILYAESNNRSLLEKIGLQMYLKLAKPDDHIKNRFDAVTLGDAAVEQ